MAYKRVTEEERRLIYDWRQEGHGPSGSENGWPQRQGRQKSGQRGNWMRTLVPRQGRAVANLGCTVASFGARTAGRLRRY